MAFGLTEKVHVQKSKSREWATIKKLMFLFLSSKMATMEIETSGVEKVMEQRRYSRSEMEALRYWNIEEQQIMWNEIYLGLDPDVANEYGGLSLIHSNKPEKHSSKNNKSKRRKPLTHGDNTEHELNENILGEDFSPNLDDFGSGSEDEYASIQRPAFFVEGDPDFDSGPPQDGLEFLRRVRWEAAQMPNVKVVKLNNVILKEQTVYMPIIPDIAKCPEHLLPSEEWEDAFLAYYSELRLASSQLDISSLQNCGYLQMWCNNDEEDSCSSSDPMLSNILGMDAVSRAAMLRSRIRSLEVLSCLSREDCAWLYALCAVVDTPLDADTGASLRCLLRKCAKLRSEKSDSDEEVVMLNILVTIAGRCFGQFEN